MHERARGSTIRAREAFMRAKRTKDQLVADCGCTDGAARSADIESDGRLENRMPSDGESGRGMLDGDSHGMPGLSSRSARAMNGAGMDDAYELAPDDGMPGGHMGDGGDGEDERSGGDGEPPRTRTCGAMDVHRRLLSTDPNYARARDAIETFALRYELGARSAQRSG
jgi:hypothetical protein